MIQRLRDRQQNEDGFTLVELLVVIVILGILASIVVFAVGGITDKGTTAANNTDVAVVQAAEEAMFAQSTLTVPVYVGEGALVTGKFLRAVSTKNDVCLSADARDYKVIPAPATNALCVTAGGAGWVYAP